MEAVLSKSFGLIILAKKNSRIGYNKDIKKTAISSFNYLTVRTNLARVDLCLAT